MAEPFLENLSGKIASLNIAIDGGIVLECKHFFSGAALYANGKICASLTPVGFGLKLPESVRDSLFEEGDAYELRYFEKAPIKREYATLSNAVVDNPDRLKSLLELSIDYVLNKKRAA